MRYGIDLDGVCFDFLNTFRKHLNGVFDVDLETEELTAYYWYEDSDKINKEQFLDRIHLFHG